MTSVLQTNNKSSTTCSANGVVNSLLSSFPVYSLQFQTYTPRSKKKNSLREWFSANFMGVISWVCVIKRQFCIEESQWVQRSCPLSGIEKRPFLGGWFYTKTVVISIRAIDFVRCREVVFFSEGPLWEVRLYKVL